jgi:hypothetical protein
MATSSEQTATEQLHDGGVRGDRMRSFASCERVVEMQRDFHAVPQ